MRERTLNQSPVGTGPVVYWMTHQRRVGFNHALEHAVDRAKALGAGLVIVETLRADTPHACARFHQFIMEGMQDNAQGCKKAGVAYHAYVEPKPGAGEALLAAYGREAALIVADDPACPDPVREAAFAALPIRVEVVDGAGLMPLSLGKRFTYAHQYRRFWQKAMPFDWPAPDPLSGAPPGEIPDACTSWDGTEMPVFATDVAPVEGTPGGHEAGRKRIKSLVRNLGEYPNRNHPDADAQSGLSPYLARGHVGAAEVAQAVLKAEAWNPANTGEPKGQRSGWWGLSEGAESFLDQLVTWREIGHMEARHNPQWQAYESLPEWVQATLEAHNGDRAGPYSLDALRRAATDDELWNAAQRQLLEEGTVQNYMRMLWGKKILEWAPSAKKALAWMLELNDQYALDGRDPNSVSGVFWCLGRYDRAWQERPVFGKVRSMTSDSARRKLRMDDYLARWAP